MTKRGVIQLNGANPIFRISKLGVDVDSAGPLDFLVHESYLIGQPFFFKFVPCPFAGYTGNSAQSADVIVNDIPAGVTSNPFVVVYPVHEGGRRVWPWAFDVTRLGGRATISYHVGYVQNSATSITIRFVRFAASQTSPDGANLVLYRQAA